MPTLTRWFVRSSLVYFLLALLLAVFLAMRPLVELPSFVIGLTPAYLHLFIVGWLTQLILGVMHWMFPKASKEKPRGDEQLVWGVFLLLNAGLILRAIAEPAMTVSSAQVWRLLLVVSAVLQWLAGLGFVVNSWPRVKGR